MRDASWGLYMLLDGHLKMSTQRRYYRPNNRLNGGLKRAKHSFSSINTLAFGQCQDLKAAVPGSQAQCGISSPKPVPQTAGG